MSNEGGEKKNINFETIAIIFFIVLTTIFWCSNPGQLSSWQFPLSTFKVESRLMTGLFVLSL
jgi:hypothetical protein